MTRTRFLRAAAVGLVMALLPTSLARQSCTAHTCTAVNHVQVTVPARLVLSMASHAVRANPSWELVVDAGTPGAKPGAAAAALDWSPITQIHDTPDPAPIAVRYTLVGS